MALRPRQKKRLLIIAAVLVVVAIAGVGAYVWRQASRDAEARDSRVQGIAALEAGEYETALSGLGRFLRRLGETEATGDDYFKYALAQKEVSSPNNGHLAGAIGMLQRSLEMEPGRREVQQALLDLYLLVGFRSEALDMIDGMLAGAPDDVDLLVLRCDILGSLGQLEAALAQAEALNISAPNHFPGFLRTAQLRLQLDQAFGEIEDWADKVVARRVDKPEFELIRAFVLTQLTQKRPGDPTYLERAGQSLDRVMVSSGSVLDPIAVSVLVGVLDGLGRFDDAVAVLEKASATPNDRVRVELLRRLWYRRRAGEIPILVEAWLRAGDSVPPEAQALRAVSLRAQGDAEAADEALDRMAASDDPDEQVWAAAVASLASNAAQTVGVATDALTSASQIAPDSALLHYWFGHLTAASDANVAREQWAVAFRLAPSWGEPMRRMAASLIGTHRQSEALRYAELAIRRSSGDPRAAATMADVLVAERARFSPAGLESVQAQIVAWKEQASGPLQAHFETAELALSAESDPESARGRLEELLTTSSDASESTLMRLAQIAATNDVDLAEQFLRSCESAYGMTPRLALARALLRARSVSPNAGLTRFDKDRRRAVDTADDLQWDLVRAAMMDRLSLPAAGESWLALANAHQESLPVQLGCLASARAWQDREAIDAVISRVEAMTGPKSSTWRVARGRFLISDPDADSESLARAVAILSEATKRTSSSVEAHVNLARALERVGNNLDRAESEFRRAAELSPQNAGIQLEIARIVGRQGRSTDSRKTLDGVLGGGELSTQQLIEAAILLAAQGDYRGGTDVLANRISIDEAPRQGLIVLASLYRQLGEYERALAICDRLMERPELDVLEIAADVNAELGRDDVARQLVARMPTVGAAPAQVALAQARFAMRRDTPAVAIAAFRRAVDAAPTDETTWAAWLEFVVATGDGQALTTLLGDPRSASIERLAFVRENEKVVRSALAGTGLRAVVLEASRNEKRRKPLLQALRAIIGEDGRMPPIAQVAPEVQALAGAHPELLSLQLVAAELAARADELPAAIDIARRAAERNPRSMLPARQLALFLARAELWDDAINAGLDWRDRVGGADLRVDAFIGNAMTQDGRIGDALTHYESKLEVALADPSAHAAYLATYAVTLTRSGQADRAEAMLAPLVTSHDRLQAAVLAVRPQDLATGTNSLTWLKLIERILPTDDAARRSAVAFEWATAFEIYGGTALAAEAATRIDAATGRDDATADDFFMAGFLAESSDDLPAAEKAYRRALVVDEKHFASRNNLAMLLARTDRADEGVMQARQVLETMPGNPAVLDTLGYTLHRAGEFAEAQQRFDEAISRAPKNTVFMLHLAETLKAMGKTGECQAAIVRIVELENFKSTLSVADAASLTALRDSLR